MSARFRLLPTMVGLVALGASVTLAVDAAAQPFSYLPPGDLIAGSGDGRADDFVYAPGMRFPIAQAPAYANSQVYMHGGMYGPGGGQCDVENYSYPWRDNYCEIRSWDMPLCPAGTGHQGQDIRPSTCDNSTHDAVATVDGTITNIGSYSVYLTAADGTRYDYLHMSNVAVTLGQAVQRGDVVGKVSNEFNGTPTTIHLHFNIRQNVDGVGIVYVPPYTSLIAAYQQLIDQPPHGVLDMVDCDAIVGWAQDVDEPDAPVSVRLGFLGGDVDESHDLLADLSRDDLCAALGSCDHGLEAPSPYSLFDGSDYQVSATAVAGPAEVELDQSPATLSCEPPAIEGVRRPVSAAALTAWSLSPFWDEPPIAAAEVEDLPLGPDMPDAPTLWRDSNDQLWLFEPPDTVRSVTAAAARAWRFDLAAAEVRDLTDEVLGTPLRPRPLMLRDGSGQAYLLDDDPGDLVEIPIPGLDDASGISGGNDGCGCRSAAAPAPRHAALLLLLAGALWGLRRRPR